MYGAGTLGCVLIDFSPAVADVDKMVVRSEAIVNFESEQLRWASRCKKKTGGTVKAGAPL